MRKFKYHNKKITTDEGVFDSKLELERWKFLKAKEEEGVIRNLQRQMKFLLIPRQTEAVQVQLKTKVKFIERFCEHPVYYVADFTYTTGNGLVIEDTKGFHTPDYIIKRKLMRFQGNPITEIKKANEWK